MSRKARHASFISVAFPYLCSHCGKRGTTPPQFQERIAHKCYPTPEAQQKDELSTVWLQLGGRDETCCFHHRGPCLKMVKNKENTFGSRRGANRRKLAPRSTMALGLGGKGRTQTYFGSTSGIDQEAERKLIIERLKAEANMLDKKSKSKKGKSSGEKKDRKRKRKKRAPNRMHANAKEARGTVFNPTPMKGLSKKQLKVRDNNFGGKNLEPELNTKERGRSKSPEDKKKRGSIVIKNPSQEAKNLRPFNNPELETEVVEEHRLSLKTSIQKKRGSIRVGSLVFNTPLEKSQIRALHRNSTRRPNRTSIREVNTPKSESALAILQKPIEVIRLNKKGTKRRFLFIKSERIFWVKNEQLAFEILDGSRMEHDHYSHSLSMREIRQISKGCERGNFKYAEKPYNPDLCFTVVTKTKTLDVQVSESMIVRDTWVKNLNILSLDRYEREMVRAPPMPSS